MIFESADDVRNIFQLICLNFAKIILFVDFKMHVTH